MQDLNTIDYFEIRAQAEQMRARATRDVFAAARDAIKDLFSRKKTVLNGQQA